MNENQNVILDSEVMDLAHQNPPLIEIPEIQNHIKEVYLLRNKIKKIGFKNNPKELPNLLKLDLSDNLITEIVDFRDLHNLKVLDLSFNLLTDFPEYFSNAEEVYLHCNDICDSENYCIICEKDGINCEDEHKKEMKSQSIDLKITNHNLKKFDIASNSLHKIPEINASNLIEFYAACNHLTEIPKNFKNSHKKLKVLGLESNHFTSLDCADLPESLESLLLSENKNLKEIKNLDLLKNLTYLDIENTELLEINAPKKVEILYSTKI